MKKRDREKIGSTTMFSRTITTVPTISFSPITRILLPLAVPSPVTCFASTVHNDNFSLSDSDHTLYRGNSQITLVDTTAEVPWVSRMINDYGTSAEKASVALLPLSGYDCVPAELGMLLAGSALEE